MISTTLLDGRIKHETPGWTGYQNPGEPMIKTKWLKDGVKYWEVKGTKNIYLVTRNTSGKINCECKGFMFRKKCKHILNLSEVENITPEQEQKWHEKNIKDGWY